MTCGWMGVCRQIFRKEPSSNYRQLPSYLLYDEFWQKTTHFWKYFANFWKSHSCFKENLPKRGPLFREFRTKNPPIWAAHTRTLNILCYPPPGGAFSSSSATTSVMISRYSLGERDLRSKMSSNAHIFMPVEARKEINSFVQGLSFILVAEDPGTVLLAAEKELSNSKEIINLVLKTWPPIIICMLIGTVIGNVIWFLVCIPYTFSVIYSSMSTYPKISMDFMTPMMWIQLLSTANHSLSISQ